MKKKLLILRETPFYTEQLLCKLFFFSSHFEIVSLYSVGRNTLYVDASRKHAGGNTTPEGDVLKFIKRGPGKTDAPS